MIGLKKKDTPLLACSFVRVCGSVGLSAGLPSAVEVNTRLAVFAKTVEVIGSPDAARSGVLKYS